MTSFHLRCLLQIHINPNKQLSSIKRLFSRERNELINRLQTHYLLSLSGTKQTSSFCSLKEALEVDWSSEKARAGLKRTPVDYFLLHGT